MTTAPTSNSKKFLRNLSFELSFWKITFLLSLEISSWISSCTPILTLSPNKYLFTNEGHNSSYLVQQNRPQTWLQRHRDPVGYRRGKDRALLKSKEHSLEDIKHEDKRKSVVEGKEMAAVRMIKRNKNYFEKDMWYIEYWWVKCAASLLPVYLVGHDVVEVIGGDKSIIIEISLVEYVVPLVIAHVLSQLLADLLQLVGGDFSLC